MFYYYYMVSIVIYVICEIKVRFYKGTNDGIVVTCGFIPIRSKALIEVS